MLCAGSPSSHLDFSDLFSVFPPFLHITTPSRVPAIALGALFSIGGIASTIFGLTISTFLIGMALQGIGVGILSHAGPVYMAESVPRDNRKAFGSIIPVAIATGFVVAQALMFVNSRRWNWQWVLGIPFISAGLVLVIGIFLPETNVYKNIVNLRAMGVNVGERVRDVEMGRSGAPVGSSTSSAGAPIVRENLSYPDDPNDREAVPIPVCHPAGLAGMGGVEECERHRRWDLHVQRLMSQPSLRNRSLVATAMQWFQQLTGFIMFVGFANFVFSQASIGDRLVLSLIFFGANLLGTAVAVGVLDQVPRKPLLLAGGIMMTICLVIAGAIVTAKHEKLAHRYSIVVSVFLCLYAFVFAATWGPLAWVYPAEMFPTAHRFEGVSMSAVNQWAAMIIFAFASSIMLRRLNVGPTLLFFMAFTAVGTVLAGLLPETLDVDPDSKQMDQLFGGSGQGYEFADKRAALPVSGAQVPASSAPSYAPSSGYEPHPFTAPSHGARLNPPAQSTLPSTYDKPTLPHVSAPATSPRTEQAATAAYRQAERERARATGRAM